MPEETVGIGHDKLVACMSAGMPGGHGAVIRHAHPSSFDRLAADFQRLTIVMARPGWPCVEETTAFAMQ